ncbi:carbohydrate ABC transporter permease [Actinomycetes bacterium KLBMP 9759]
MSRYLRLRLPSPGMAVSNVLAWGYALLLVIPLFYLVVSSFKQNVSIFTRPFAIAVETGWDNFTAAIERAGLVQATANSLLVTVLAEVLTLALAIPAAYALARSTGRVAAIVERFFGLGFLIPGFAALVPTVLLAVQLGLFQTRTFLVLFLPAGALPLSVIMLTQFMRTVPPALEEAASLDGASRLQILMKVYVPITMPGIATVVILNFLNFWNEYLFALVLAGPDPVVRTTQVALPSLISQNNTEYGVLAAGTLLTLVPVFIVYLVLQRRMERAMLSGAVKL